MERHKSKVNFNEGNLESYNNYNNNNFNNDQTNNNNIKKNEENKSKLKYTLDKLKKRKQR